MLLSQVFIYVKAPMHINSQLGFSKFQFFNGQNGQASGTASLCQILAKSLQPRPRYGDFSISKDGGRRHVRFLKFPVEKAKKVEVHQCAKFRRNRLNCGRNMVIFDF